MNEVWRAEVTQNPLLKRTRYVWLKNPENLTEKQQSQSAHLISNSATVSPSLKSRYVT